MILLFKPEIIFVLLIPFTNGNSNKVCRINDRRAEGSCKPLTECPEVIGLLHAGVKPTSCKSQGPDIVCCPSEGRISSKKCDEFMNILTTPLKSTQTLVFDGNDNDKKREDNTIKCESFLHVYISGGVNAKPRQFPYQVALGYGEKPDWRCGGTLIDPSYVLTAAHCIRTSFGPPKVVLLGDIQLNRMHNVPRRIVLNVSETYVHPKYKPPMEYNDIAIIKLQSPVVLSRSILPACLPNPSDRLDRVIAVEATGWGRTGAFGERSETLKSVTLAKFNSTDCTLFFQEENAGKDRLPNGITRSQFCAGDKFGLRDTCGGDSGGPVTVENKDYSCVRYVVGITSFGPALCGYQQPGVYTNVLSYLHWIEDIVWRNLSLKEISNWHPQVPIFDDRVPTTTSIAHVMPTIEHATSSPHKIQNTTASTSSMKPFTYFLPINFPSPTTAIPSETTVMPPSTQLNQQRYDGFFNISSTIADLFNKLTIGR